MHALSVTIDTVASARMSWRWMGKLIVIREVVLMIVVADLATGVFCGSKHFLGRVKQGLFIPNQGHSTDYWIKRVV